VPTSRIVLEDPFPKVFTYIYSNQDFESIRAELNEVNISNIYSMAHTL